MAGRILGLIVLVVLLRLLLLVLVRVFFLLLVLVLLSSSSSRSSSLSSSLSSPSSSCQIRQRFTTPDYSMGFCNAQDNDGDVLCHALCCAVPCCIALKTVVPH